MDIQWFPGHMTKAYRMMEKEIKLVDSLIYLLDARCIEACFNPKFDALIGNKPVLYVINKADLCEEKDIADWIKEFKNRGKNVMFCNSTASKDRKKIIENLKKINLPTIERYKLKGVNKVVRAMVVGVPNSGKSTLVNCLCGYKKTATGNIAGVTRGKQWVTLENNIEILDTPGTLWGRFENQTYAKHLAFVGSIKDGIYNNYDMALEILQFFKTNYTQQFLQRFNLEMVEETLIMFDKIALNRGMIIKGGEPDVDRTASAIVDDFRKQKIAKVMLEKVKEKQ